MSPKTFSHTLLNWFAANGRDLPWRHTHDPYAIWLSEIILQQTRISQGVAYWERFMETYPTVDKLAAASEDDVLKLWQGLGYYSRARNLHKAARQIVSLGHFPDTLDGLQKLKGVGDYTAAAIASFAFGIPAAAVDGNFYRVLSRIFGIGTPINSTEGKKVFQALADDIMAVASQQRAPVSAIDWGSAHLEGGAAALNAAMMDFGATQCTPKSPACVTCPFNEDCEALRQGRVDELPVKLKTVKVKQRHFIYLYIRCNGQTAIRRRGRGDIWQGLWEPYLVSQSRGKPVADSVSGVSVKLPKEIDAMAARTNGHAQMICHGVKHVLTHQVILADFYLLETHTRPELPADYIWIDEADIDRYAVPRLVEILLERLANR
ncbi:putative A/G-specific adenine glycosylase [Bacteroidales bacterium KA00344]|nr:putative A/G-specific adenine glycosylase [Bacteroidales bacterium KA00344]